MTFSTRTRHVAVAVLVGIAVVAGPAQAADRVLIHIVGTRRPLP